MILRRPFAILIKNFKLIHIILTVLTFYLITKTNLLLSFFNEYTGTHNSVIGKDLTGELYSVWIYISLLVIIVGSLIILGLMLFKHKKIKLYIYNILTHIFVSIIYIFTYSVLSFLEIELVDLRTLKMVQDLLTTSYILQLISLILVAMRATGFDVHKFNFREDLQELEIEDVDNEEFEVNIDLNSDETKRKINRSIRHAKYIYKENKFVITLLLLVIVGISSIAIYMNVGVYNKIYKKNEAFSTTYFTMQLSDAYSTNQDYKGNTLYEDESLLAVHVKIKNNTTKERTFDSARLALQIDEHYFYHETIYDEQMIDMGTIYKKQNVKNEFEDYVFIYKIPTDFLDNKILLTYTDYNNKTIRMKVTHTSLIDNKEEKSYNINDTIDFSDSILGNTKVQINTIDLQNTFRIDYNYCLNNTCYPSYEYLKPTYSGKNNKTLLKIEGTLTEENNKYNNLCTMVNYFGYLEYQLENKSKTVALNTKNITPTKTTIQNQCYIETLEEIKNANKINLVFKVRNKTYKYTVK